MDGFIRVNEQIRTDRCACPAYEEEMTCTMPSTVGQEERECLIEQYNSHADMLRQHMMCRLALFEERRDCLRGECDPVLRDRCDATIDWSSCEPVPDEVAELASCR